MIFCWWVWISQKLHFLINNIYNKSWYLLVYNVQVYTAYLNSHDSFKLFQILELVYSPSNSHECMNAHTAVNLIGIELNTWFTIGKICNFIPFSFQMYEYWLLFSFLVYFYLVIICSWQCWCSHVTIVLVY